MYEVSDAFFVARVNRVWIDFWRIKFYFESVDIASVLFFEMEISYERKHSNLFLIILWSIIRIIVDNTPEEDCTEVIFNCIF